MKKIKHIFWGILLVAVGVIWALNVCGVTDINLLFKGWWTLFIILPCAVGLFTERDKLGHLIGLAVGVILLLGTRDILPFDLLWKLLVPVAVILIGLRLIFKDIFRKKEKKWLRFDRKSAGARAFSAIFSGEDVNYNGIVFEGAELTAVFGGIDCDLRGAIIERDVAIEVNAVFGGVDILLPANVNLRISSTSVFGGTSNERGGAELEGVPTVFVNSTCVFGGVDVK